MPRTASSSRGRGATPAGCCRAGSASPSGAAARGRAAGASDKIGLGDLAGGAGGVA
ncbi:hypothetical protein HMPREF0731_4136, partial [Pseudoroseomonas cervicalis ATCC 49957]